METNNNYSRIEQCGMCHREFESCPFYEENKEMPCGHYELPIDNSRMFSHFFSTKGRIGRTEYIITAVLCILLTIFIIPYVAREFSNGDYEDPVTNIIVGSIAMLPMAIILVFAGYKRCHDSTSPTWYAWVPSVSLFIFLGWISVVICSAAIFFLVFQKGDEGINAHGTEPGKPYQQQIADASQWVGPPNASI